MPLLLHSLAKKEWHQPRLQQPRAGTASAAATLRNKRRSKNNSISKLLVSLGSRLYKVICPGTPAAPRGPAPNHPPGSASPLPWRDAGCPTFPGIFPRSPPWRGTSGPAALCRGEEPVPTRGPRTINTPGAGRQRGVQPMALPRAPRSIPCRLKVSAEPAPKPPLTPPPPSSLPAPFPRRCHAAGGTSLLQGLRFHFERSGGGGRDGE